MVTQIQPFDFERNTNIKEHNQIVDKINEMIDYIVDQEIVYGNTTIVTSLVEPGIRSGDQWHKIRSD